jgi:hypothetical protein
MPEDFVTIEELSRGAIIPREALAGQAAQGTIKVIQAGAPVDAPSIIPETRAYPVDLKNLINSQGEIVKFSLSNTSANPKVIYLGTCIPFEENWVGLGLPAPGNASPDVEDQLGGTAPKLRVFNKRVNYKNGIVLNQINVFAPASSPARQIVFEKVQLDLNANQCVTTGRIPVSDTQINGVFHTGLFPLADNLGVKFTIPANTSFELELSVLAEGVPTLKRV